MSDAPIQGDRSRRSADRLYDEGKYCDAEAIYLELLAEEQSGDRWWVYFQLGRVALRLNRAVDALFQFDRALLEPDPLPWVYYERSHALRAAGGALEAILADMRRFVACAPETLAAGNYGEILNVAHEAFKAGCYDDARELYEFLCTRGQHYYISQIRRADISLNQNYSHKALELLDEIRGHENHDEWEDFLRGQAYYKLENFSDAVTCFCEALLRRPDNIYFEERLLDALNRIRPKISSEEKLKYIEFLPVSKKQEFIVLWNIQDQKFEKIDIDLQSFSASGLNRISTAAVDILNRLRCAEDYTLIETILDGTRAIELGLCAIVCAALTAYFRARRWSDAAALVLRGQQNPDLVQDGDFWVRRLEYFSYTLQYDKALEQLASQPRDYAIPASGTSVIAALYATLGRWDDVLDFVISRVAADFPILDHLLLEAVTRATRHRHRYADTLRALEHAIARSSHPNLVNRRDHLVEELRFLTHLAPGQFETVDESLTKIAPLRATRSAMMTALLTPPTSSVGQKSVFLCTDRKYLIGCCVAVYSLIRNNITKCRVYNIFVFCDSDCLDLATAIFQRISTIFSCSIQVCSASAVLDAEHRFTTRWGMFTPDQGLSNAAYYRIYAARHLLRSSIGGRALYLDSDTIVTSGIDRLLEWDLEGLPLGAHRDQPDALIEGAAARLGVDPGTYFNSGVMLFDLDHPELDQRLNHAIDFAVNRPHLLTFVDQCALNGGFFEGVNFLPAQFNYFVRARVPIPNFVYEPVVWHFLEVPKPWDPLYATHNCDRWFHEFVGFGDCVGDRCLRELLSLQFPGKLAVTMESLAQP